MINARQPVQRQYKLREIYDCQCHYDSTRKCRPRYDERYRARATQPEVTRLTTYDMGE